MYYFYFTYFLDVPKSGAQCKNDGVTMSNAELFPIGNVFTYFREEFGDDAEITILSVVQISEEDYEKLSKKIGTNDD